MPATMAPPFTQRASQPAPAAEPEPVQVARGLYQRAVAARALAAAAAEARASRVTAAGETPLAPHPLCISDPDEDQQYPMAPAALAPSRARVQSAAARAPVSAPAPAEPDGRNELERELADARRALEAAKSRELEAERRQRATSEYNDVLLALLGKPNSGRADRAAIVLQRGACRSRARHTMRSKRTAAARIQAHHRGRSSRTVILGMHVAAIMVQMALRDWLRVRCRARRQAAGRPEA